jgi:hypothetical protein
MIISKKHKFIILSVPKTGSTAMQFMFSTMLKGEVNCVYSNNRTKGGLRKHITAKELKNNIPGFDSYKKIAVVRNPWDYVVSWYAYTKRLPEGHKRSSVGKNFNQFLREMKHVWFNYPEPWRNKTWNVTQMSFVANKNNELLVDEIIRFEDMRRDGISETMKQVLNLDLGQSNVDKNTSERLEDYRDYYNYEEIEIVRKAMGIDIKTFGYEY